MVQPWPFPRCPVTALFVHLHATLTPHLSSAHFCCYRTAYAHATRTHCRTCHLASTRAHTAPPYPSLAAAAGGTLLSASLIAAPCGWHFSLPTALFPSRGNLACRMPRGHCGLPASFLPAFFHARCDASLCTIAILGGCAALNRRSVWYTFSGGGQTKLPQHSGVITAHCDSTVPKAGQLQLVSRQLFLWLKRLIPVFTDKIPLLVYARSRLAMQAATLQCFRFFFLLSNNFWKSSAARMTRCV